MWTLGGVRIYVQEFSGNSGQIIARLQPVNGGTVLHFFGHESTIRNATALVVGDANLDSLRTMSKNSGVSYTLVGPEGTVGNFYVRSVNFNRLKSTCQTIDTSQPEDAPLYEVELELFLED